MQAGRYGLSSKEWTPAMVKAVYDNLNGAVREAQRAMREFRENPKKFLRLKLF